MKTVVLDTNFLMIPYQFKVDIFEEIERVCRFPYKLHIVEGTLKELQRLIEKGDAKEKKAATFAVSLVKQYHLAVIKGHENDVDSTLAGLPPKDLIVATSDQELKKRLKDRGIALLVLRQQKYLQLIE